MPGTTALMLAFTVMLAAWFGNLLVHRYSQGAIRQAADEGARAMARNQGTAAECLERAESVITDLLGGQAGNVTFSCRLEGGRVVVEANAVLPAIPPFSEVVWSTSAQMTNELEDGLTEDFAP